MSHVVPQNNLNKNYMWSISKNEKPKWNILKMDGGLKTNISLFRETKNVFNHLFIDDWDYSIYTLYINTLSHIYTYKYIRMILVYKVRKKDGGYACAVVWPTRLSVRNPNKNQRMCTWFVTCSVTFGGKKAPQPMCMLVTKMMLINKVPSLLHSTSHSRANKTAQYSPV